MTLEVRLRPLVRRDIDRHVDFIATDRPETAERFAERVLETFSLLAGQPGIGAVWNSRSRTLRGLRRWPVVGFGKFLVFYFVRDDHVEIVRILHSAMSLGRELRKSP
ncbi:MAG: type II toxin-antitoxin system RelE/ParE family toxin [Tepidisphaera sp.]